MHLIRPLICWDLETHADMRRVETIYEYWLQSYFTQMHTKGTNSQRTYTC